MAALPRRRKAFGHRRRVEDEGEDEGGPEALDIDDDSLTEGSIISDDNDAGDDSDTSNVDEASPTSANVRKAAGNGDAKSTGRQQTGAASSTAQPPPAAITDTELMLNGLHISNQAGTAEEIQFDDVVTSPSKAAAPIVVSSSSAPQPPDGPPYERRRREHEEYRKKRDEDPAFVPNRGAFFMHDHRHAGPSANGFRPFGRARRGGRGGLGGPFAPINQIQNSTDPTTNAPWAHDMHEAVAEPVPPRQTRHMNNVNNEGIANGDGHIPTCPPSATPINRTLSTEKLLGNAQVRVFFPPFKTPIIFSGVPVKQYTKLPDHRPPLRRDKPVRISLPDHPPRYIFPAVDRSFIFIPRAMRPNQQRMRGKPRSGLGSVSGFSRRTSVFGGSYYGSAYSPSIALSRRSSIAPEMGRDYIVSPTGSAISRPPFPADTSRPIVRLPPLARPDQPASMPMAAPGSDIAGAATDRPPAVGESSINDLPPPQTHPLPQKPTFQENRPGSVVMQHPRPQKAVSVENIESPTMQMNPSQPYQQAFHQQVPVQVSNGFPHETHVRHPSYPSQHSTGTPLSQIPERAIHAAPFQPNAYQQQGYYGQPYQMMQPQQGYYYPPGFGNNMGPSATAPAFVPGAQQPQAPNFPPVSQGDPANAQANGQAQPSQNLVAQEVNGMVYYYDAAQMPNVPSYPSFPGSQNFVPGVVGMGGMVTPSPDGFYYPQQAPPMMYYSQ